jgi:hypothetical protein
MDDVVIGTRLWTEASGRLPLPFIVDIRQDEARTKMIIEYIRKKAPLSRK